VRIGALPALFRWLLMAFRPVRLPPNLEIAKLVAPDREIADLTSDFEIADLVALPLTSWTQDPTP
jgi:hypothetical protein